MERKDYSKWLPIVVNTIVFLVILSLCKIIYGADEDLYVVYTLGGGFGYPPSELVHLNYGMHPWMTLALSKLFQWNDQVNWYSITLVLAHFISTTIILNSLIRSFSVATGIAIYISLFLIFEIPVLLQINFNGTAIVLSIAALILLGESVNPKRANALKMIGSILLIVGASLFRIHVIIPFVLMAIPYFFLIRFKFNLLYLFISLGISALFILLLNNEQENYYQSKIPGWHKEESRRQLIYKYYNQPVNAKLAAEKWPVETDLLNRGLIIDSTFLSDSKLSQINSDLFYKRDPQSIFNSEGNWLFINNRIFLFALVATSFFVPWSWKNSIAIVIAFVIMLSILGYLFVAMKLRDYMIPALLYFFILANLLLTAEARDGNQPKFIRVVKGVFIFSMIGWGVVRTVKLSNQNIDGNEQFKMAQAELQSHPGLLFIVTDDHFPFDRISAWDVPVNYPVTNMVYKLNLLNQSADSLLSRFGADSPATIPSKKNIVFWGRRSPGLETYFEEASGKKINVSEPMPEFKYGEVRNIEFEEPVMLNK